MDYQQISNIIIQEINPRLKKGGKMPNPNTVAFFIELKNKGLINHITLRKFLDYEMFPNNHEELKAEQYLKDTYGITRQKIDNML